jgi:hypothetical protein
MTKTMRAKFKRSKAWKRALQMPPLFHQRPGEEFDLAKSEVVNWLCTQAEIRQALFDFYRFNGAIVFRDGRWHGADNSNNA